MSAYIVFTRTKTLDQKELETYWAGIKATSRTSACSWDSLPTDQASETALRCALM